MCSEKDKFVYAALPETNILLIGLLLKPTSNVTECGKINRDISWIVLIKTIAICGKNS